MTLGGFVVLVLRLAHIFGAFAWIGGAMFLNGVVFPVVGAAGPDGAKFMSWVGRTGRLATFLTAAALTTIVAGVLLFFPTSGNFNGAWLGSAHGIVLSTGAVLGLVAFFHGVFGAGAVARRAGALAKEMAARNGPPAPEQIQLAQALGASSARHAMISLALGALTLLFMSGAQSF